MAGPADIIAHLFRGVRPRSPGLGDLWEQVRKHAG